MLLATSGSNGGNFSGDMHFEFSKNSECQIEKYVVDDHLITCGCGMQVSSKYFDYEFDVSQFSCYYETDSVSCFSLPVSIFYNVDPHINPYVWACIDKRENTCIVKVNFSSIIWKISYITSDLAKEYNIVGMYNELDSCFNLKKMKRAKECMFRVLHGYCLKGEDPQEKCLLDFDRYVYLLFIINAYKFRDSIDGYYSITDSISDSLIMILQRTLGDMEWVETSTTTIYWFMETLKRECKLNYY